jgi:membrane protein DedA with SNARE-associated domain
MESVAPWVIDRTAVSDHRFPEVAITRSKPYLARHFRYTNALISRLLSELASFIVWVISGSGYLGIVLLMAIESACIPLPSEVIMPFAGALVVPAVAMQYHRAPFSLLWVAVAGAIGCNLGSLVAYLVGYYGGRPLVERYGRYVLLTRHELDLSESFFRRWGSMTVLVARMLPVVRTFIALPAGVARMEQVRFHVYTFVGSFPWCLGLAWVGMKLGERWESDPRLKLWFHRLDVVILIVIVAAVALFVWSRTRASSRLPARTSH